jgi:signal transduction histidine kinase
MLRRSERTGQAGKCFWTGLVAVQDSGPGLSSESLDRLFDAFYTTKRDGLGMGWRSD